MIVHVPEIQEGPNPIRFEVPAGALDAIVKDMDGLFSARGAAEVRFDVLKVDALLTVHGRIRAPIAFECARCLSERARSLDVGVHWTLLPKAGLGSDLSREEEIELTADDLDTSFYGGEDIDLAELAREAILLELDPAPRCADDERCTPHPAVMLAGGGSGVDAHWGPLAAALEARRTLN